VVEAVLSQVLRVLLQVVAAHLVVLVVPALQDRLLLVVLQQVAPMMVLVVVEMEVLV
jgi:hypothetical protein